MRDERHEAAAWNDEARISCEFSFKCPKTWERLSPTNIANVRHCPECDREVHLALTEADFRQHADAGRCVAVRVIRPGRPRKRDVMTCTLGVPRMPEGHSPMPDIAAFVRKYAD